MHSRVWIFALLFVAAAFSSASAGQPMRDLLKELSPQACASCGKTEKFKEKMVVSDRLPTAGTGYIWKVLRVCGIIVGHEKEGDKGIVSWLFTADSDRPAWGPKPIDYNFKNIFHQVRHPLKCIATMHLVVDKAWRYICREEPQIKMKDPILVRCAKMWVYWNLKAEKKAEMTYRVEAIKEAFPEMSRRLGVKLNPDMMKRVSKRTHSTEHDYVVTWQDLHRALEPDFYKQLVLLAQRYGYDVKEGKALIGRWGAMKRALIGLLTICGLAFGSVDAGAVREERQLLITGCARSGTAYVARVLRDCGLDVGHEKDASFGLVSWPMTVDTPQRLWGPPSGRYRFKHIFHQVRHPLKTIASFHLANELSWRYVFKHIPEIKLNDKMIVRCAKYWVYWNLKAEKRAEWTYRVEDMEKALPEMSRRLGVPLDASVLKNISKHYHQRPYHVHLTWEILHRTLKEELYTKVVRLAERYGYDVKEALTLLNKAETPYEDEDRS